MSEVRIPEVLISIDGEFTGLIPGPHSMISLGAVAYSQDGTQLSTFSVNLEELPDSIRLPSTMEWWDKHPDAWELATKDPIKPKEGMICFDAWLKKLPGGPKLMGWPLPVDFMFVYWYYVNFMGVLPPFGFDGIDIKTYAMSQLKILTFSEVSRTDAMKRLGIATREFSHDALDDSIRQAEIFFALRSSAQ